MVQKAAVDTVVTRLEVDAKKLKPGLAAADAQITKFSNKAAANLSKVNTSTLKASDSMGVLGKAATASGNSMVGTAAAVGELGIAFKALLATMSPIQIALLAIGAAGAAFAAIFSADILNWWDDSNAKAKKHLELTKAITDETERRSGILAAEQGAFNTFIDALNARKQLAFEIEKRQLELAGGDPVALAKLQGEREQETITARERQAQQKFDRDTLELSSKEKELALVLTKSRASQAAVDVLREQRAETAPGSRTGVDKRLKAATAINDKLQAEGKVLSLNIVALSESIKFALIRRKDGTPSELGASPFGGLRTVAAQQNIKKISDIRAKQAADEIKRISNILAKTFKPGEFLNKFAKTLGKDNEKRIKNSKEIVKAEKIILKIRERITKLTDASKITGRAATIGASAFGGATGLRDAATAGGIRLKKNPNLEQLKIMNQELVKQTGLLRTRKEKQVANFGK